MKITPSKQITLIVLPTILLIALGGCDTLPTALPTPSNTAASTSTLEPTSTSTSTPTITPTNTPIAEKDLEPVYIETVSQIYDGVEIKLNLITDATLDGAHINRVYLNPKFSNHLGENSKDAFAHFTALLFYKLWKSRQDTPQSTSNNDFESFLMLWSQAQKSNDPVDWKKVQINKV